jgi:hypothetical protein
MKTLRGEGGFTLVILSLLVLAAIGTTLALDLAQLGGTAHRARTSDRALAQAREALIAYATARPVNPAVGPGYLPCPDLDDDGWAEATCGSLSGDSGQEQRLGRLPWKTLGLPDLRDGDGERLWYAVSSKYKGLLNCGASRGCVDMTPYAALGTITVRDPSGAPVHDGTATDPMAVSGGAAAVVFAPGSALQRLEANGAATQQRRECAPGECDAVGRCLTDPPQRAARCNPANYLDRAPRERSGEDNAAFTDRNDGAGRLANTDGFIQGPIRAADRTLVVNDRLAVIAYRDVMPRIMARVALEVANCLRHYAARDENRGRMPWPAPLCATPAAVHGREGVFFGRMPDTPFAVPGAMLDRWPTAGGDSACNISEAGDTAGLLANSWWTPWKAHVGYALARGFAPDAQSPACRDQADCVVVRDTATGVERSERRFAIAVAYAPVPRDSCGECADGACGRLAMNSAAPDHVVIPSP